MTEPKKPIAGAAIGADAKDRPSFNAQTVETRAARVERLAIQMRRNLLKRKQQQRIKSGQAGGDPKDG